MKLLRMTRLKRRYESMALYRVGETVVYRGRPYEVTAVWFDEKVWRYLIGLGGAAPRSVPEESLSKRVFSPE